MQGEKRMNKEEMKVISHRTIAHQIYEMVLEGDLAKNMKMPGQFVHIKVAPGVDPLLRRPISICDADPENGRVTLIYRAEGKGTAILAKTAPGETVDVLGPLGNGFPADEAKPGQTALLVGGGIGVPPLYNLSKQLNLNGVRTVHVIGFASKRDVFYAEKFAELGDVYTATADGTEGQQGFVTDVIRDKQLSFDVLYACGPTPMLRALDEQYKDRKGFLSLEERMGCGIGACYACVCKLQNDPEGTSYRRICKEGPVFPIGEVLI